MRNLCAALCCKTCRRVDYVYKYNTDLRKAYRRFVKVALKNTPSDFIRTECNIFY